MTKINKSKRTKLEFFVCARALNYNANCWLYLTTIQKILALEVLEALERLCTGNKENIMLDELIDEAVSRVNGEEKLAYYKSNFNFSFSNNDNGKKFSREAVRSTIYLMIPTLLAVKQFKKAKIMSLTDLSDDFLVWKNRTYQTEEGKTRKNRLIWRTTDIIHFIEAEFDSEVRPEDITTNLSSNKETIQKPNIKPKKIVTEQEKAIRQQRAKKILDYIITKRRKEIDEYIEANKISTKEFSEREIFTVAKTYPTYLRKRGVIVEIDEHTKTVFFLKSKTGV